jgi:hypothetical protein
MRRIGKRTILVVAAISGIGLSYLIQPCFPPYSVRGRVAFIGPSGSRELFYPDLDTFARSVIRSRRTPHTGAVGGRLGHPRGRENEYEIVITSRDREFSSLVVNDLLSHARDVGGANVEVLETPTRVVLDGPSLPVLMMGMGAGLLMGFVFVRRFPGPDEPV